MAIGNIKTAREARLVGEELQNAAQELYVGILMTQDPDPIRVLTALRMVGEDFVAWAGDKDDHEEVFVPTNRVAEIDQATAEYNDFINKLD